MNIRFEYLYRDAGNNKNWGDVIFSNYENIEVAEINQSIRTILIDQEFFVADTAGVSELHFSKHVDSLDHGWHEFYAFKTTTAEPTDEQGRDIIEFIKSLEHASKI